MTIYTWPDPGQDEGNIVGSRLADQIRELGIPAYAHATARDAAVVEVLAGGLSVVAGTGGLEFQPGSDTDVDLITVDVAGSPRVWWDESDNRFTMTHGLDIDGGKLVVSGGDIEWGANGNLSNVGLGYFDTSVDSVSASTTQSQGNGLISNQVVLVSIVSNPNDVVTLPEIDGGGSLPSTGAFVAIRNGGANTLQIFPSSGDSIDGGVLNGSVTLAAGSSAIFFAVNSTQWYTFGAA